ncbi:hypothetical protein C8J38_1011153 [Rhizobium sp. PP-WC-2G-219]|nr:hypothetical protein C8J38_1011153 [Rhizobium sp. PP-WC-2G-219]
MSVLRNQLLPWIKVLACQALVLVSVLFLSRWITPGTLPVLLGQGAAAAGLGFLLRMPRIWLVVQFLLPIAVVYGDAVPAWAYLVAFVLCALVYWNSASEQVPLYLTNRRTWQALADLVAASGAKSVVDLGSGMGGVVTFLARAHPGVEVSGLETAPLVVVASKLRIALSRLPNARIVYRSLWEAELGTYDVVYCFLSPVPMARLFEKARREMRPGTLFVSNSFTVPGRAADRILDVDDGRRTQLHIYTL